MVQDFDKTRDLLHDMKQLGVSPSAATFDELLLGFSRHGLFNDGISLLKDMDEDGIKPSSLTLAAVAKLVNSARLVNHKCSYLQKVLSKYNFEHEGVVTTFPNSSSQVPRLMAAVIRCNPVQEAACIHDVEIKGSLAEVDVLRGTLMRHRFLIACFANGTWTLDTQRDKQQDELYQARFAGVIKR